MGFPESDSERFGPEKALMLAGYFLESGGSVTILCVAEFSQNSTLRIFYGKVDFCLNLMGHTQSYLSVSLEGGFGTVTAFFIVMYPSDVGCHCVYVLVSLVDE